MNKNTNENKSDNVKGSNFLEIEIDKDIESNRFDGRVYTRFPPEPNGYLHIGHAKSICINFGLAAQYNGNSNLRMDDTNPSKEDAEYEESIKTDVQWLGFKWTKLCYASDYFEQLYQWAELLITKGFAYVCDHDGDTISAMRGTTSKPGEHSKFRNRSIEENLQLFRDMRAGKFAEGEKTLRAKIDMAHPNFLMRDPILYRIQHKAHHRTNNDWCIYPMYDFAHGQSDSIEGITHSICTLEFEVHRPLYDWFLQALGIYAPRQIEFAKLNITYWVLGKRRLLEMVTNKYVNGWDDPRLPTLSGLRRRGYTPDSIRHFADKIGVAKADNTIEMELLEFCLREDLNKKSNRVMGVLNPLKVVIINYPDNFSEEMEADNNPEDATAGKRMLPFSKELYIEQEDFMENPPKDFFRLGPGREVRLRYAYFIKCENVIKDAEGKITEIQCTYDSLSRGGKSPDGRVVKSTIHWISILHALKAEIRLYERMFNVPDPDILTPEQQALGLDYKANLNPNSLKVITGFVEPSLANSKPMDQFQFERIGYFCIDKDTTTENLVFNRSVTLKDPYKKKTK